METIGAIYVHDTKSTPYALAIVQGRKPLETRSRDVLGRFVGQNILIIRTRSGHPAEVIGSATITGKEFKTVAEMEALRDQTLIPAGSKFDATGKGKWCYRLENPHEMKKPVPLAQYTVVSRNMSYAILEVDF